MNKRLLLDFLRQQTNNRAEQVKIHRAYRNPNAQLLGKLQTEQKMFEEVARIVDLHDFSTVTETSEEFEHQRLSTNKRPTERPSPLTNEDDHSPPLAVSPKVTANGKRIGRPPKMTMRQIEASKNEPIGVAVNDKD